LNYKVNKKVIISLSCVFVTTAILCFIIFEQSFWVNVIKVKQVSVNIPFITKEYKRTALIALFLIPYKR